MSSGSLAFCALGLLMLFGVPIYTSIALATIVGFLFIDVDLIVVAQRALAGAQIYTLIAIPGFILLGELMIQGGMSRRLIRSCRVLTGSVSGGLGVVTVLSATLFAAISGSAPATTAAIGSVMVPAMKKEGYSDRFATALATVSGPIGQLIPPSIPMVIWGVLAEQSITKLFLAGVFPGLLIAFGLIIVCLFVKPTISSVAKKTEDSKELPETGSSVWALLGPVIILGGIYGGVFTPTEASAIGVVYALCIGAFVYKELNPAALYSCIVRALTATGMIGFIVIFASAFGWLMAFEQVPTQIANLLFAISENPIIVLLLLNLLMLIIGGIMDNVAAMIVLSSMIISIGHTLNIDPIQLGAMVVANFAIGMATPPFGYALFVGAAVGKVPLSKLSTAVLPLLVVHILVLLIMTFVPAVTTWLPSIVYGG